MGNLLTPGFKPVSLALAGGFLSTVPPGKYCLKLFLLSAENFQMFKLDLEKAEEQEIKLTTFVESLKKQESS